MRKHIIWSFDKDYLQKVIDGSSSYKEVCDKLKISFNKSVFKMIAYRIKVDALNKAFFSENIKKARKYDFIGKDLKEILVSGSTYTSTNNLKLKLFKCGILTNECSKCGVKEWCGEPISCQLDHINGISNDNRLENLRILCPNCHSQTDTYSNKKRKLVKNKEKIKKCIICKCDISNGLLCTICQKTKNEKSRKIVRPSKETLFNEINEMGYSATGRKYGVSDNAIRKWLK